MALMSLQSFGVYSQTIIKRNWRGQEDEQRKLMQAEERVSGGVRKDLPYGRLKFKVCQEVYHFWGRKLHLRMLDRQRIS